MSLSIPYAPAGTVVRSYKIMPRAVNAHAYVNATFSMTVDSNNGFTVTSSPSLVFGGIDTHAVSIHNYTTILVSNVYDIVEDGFCVPNIYGLSILVYKLILQ